MADSINYVKESYQLRMNWARHKFIKGDYDGVHAMYLEMLAKYSHLKEKKNSGIINCKLALTARIRGEYMSAFRFVQEAKKNFALSEDKSLRYDYMANKELIDIYIDLKNYQRSIENLQ
ncbi:hypothetical protein PK35_02545 [Tamlana nanhaiensis]|uniref:Tetratricopeptide repeat protein n=1 Tax=Neotamlana nanhaiensis TaxID=1382798 RepID=A0A0D7W6C0_9FLAO|nr:hypothetical protein [Tamlana nanhaiensis]KJD34670.1 hypothetical protein PK35_02545 [Tamlana nanhaiensis]